VAPTDGRDIVNGGTEGAAGDTFVINGNASSETFRIYTRAAWDALPGNNGGSLNGATEIVVTRNGTGFNEVIGELREIEEIRINGTDPSGSGVVNVGADTFELIGDFTNTSLRLNTVTIAGTAASDIVNISGLTSQHRVVFTGNGGEDQVIGDPRPQDVLNMSAPAASFTPAAFMTVESRAFDLFLDRDLRGPVWKMMRDDDFFDMVSLPYMDRFDML
jgi:hypothetical protein